MKNIDWIKKDEKYFLQNGDAVLIELVISLTADSFFFINNKRYVLTKKGFWNPVYLMQCQGEEVLRFSYSFWGSNGYIVCKDTSVYEAAFTNGGGLKLRFTDGGNEILSYGLTFAPPTYHHNFSIGMAWAGEEKLLLLCGLGKVLFESILGEDAMNNDAVSSMHLLSVATTV